jgi:hypothetical protein
MGLFVLINKGYLLSERKVQVLNTVPWFLEMPIHNSSPRALFKSLPLLSRHRVAWKPSITDLSRKFTTRKRTRQYPESTLRKPRRVPLTPEQLDYLSAAVRRVEGHE